MFFNWKKVALVILAVLVIGSGWLIPAGLIHGGNPGSQLHNLEFINVDLRQVFRSLAAMGKFNVILDQTVQGNVSIAFKAGVTAKEAVAVIATNYGYGYQWISGANQVFVGNSKAYPQGFGEKFPVDIELKYSDAAAVTGSLETVIPKERIKQDSNGYKVTIFGNSLEIQNVKEIVSRIDRRHSTVNLDLKIAEVTDEFWKDTGVNLAVIRSHIGVYSLTQPQLQLLKTGNKDVIHYLAHRSINLWDNQDGKLSFADKFSARYQEDNKIGSHSAPPGDIWLGTTIGITSWVGEGERITLQLKEATVAVVNQPKQNANLAPVVRSREVISIISVAAGQTFALTGIIGRDEYNRIKGISGTFPVLQELFSSDNGFEAGRKKTALVIMLITPVFSEKKPGSAGENKLQTGQNGQVTQDIETTANQAQGEPKTVINLDIPQTTANSIQKTAADQSVTLIEYPVKINDTITGIAIKFNIERQMIITANQLENKQEIPAVLLIPVPNDRIYIVKPKETLWRIAKRYDTTIDLLKDLNCITDETQIKAGQKLILPVSTSRIINPQF